MLPCLFNLYAEYITQNARLDEAQAGIKIAGRNINKLRYADDTTLMAKSEEELKSLFMRVKEESEKSWLKTQHSGNEDHGIRSHHFMGNRWGKSGKCQTLFLGAPKSLQMVIAAMKFKRCLLLGKTVMTNLDSIFKSRDITLLTKVHLVRPIVFPGMDVRVGL